MEIEKSESHDRHLLTSAYDLRKVRNKNVHCRMADVNFQFRSNL